MSLQQTYPVKDISQADSRKEIRLTQKCLANVPREEYKDEQPLKGQELQAAYT